MTPTERTFDDFWKWASNLPEGKGLHSYVSRGHGIERDDNGFIDPDSIGVGTPTIEEIKISEDMTEATLFYENGEIETLRIDDAPADAFGQTIHSHRFPECYYCTWTEDFEEVECIIPLAIQRCKGFDVHNLHAWLTTNYPDEFSEVKHSGHSGGVKWTCGAYTYDPAMSIADLEARFYGAARALGWQIEEAKED